MSKVWFVTGSSRGLGRALVEVALDGVIQGNGGASDEDRRSGFERGGWAMGVFDDESMTFITQTDQSADAFLFGRRTYEASA